jgi:hypothetical protein
MTNQNKQPERGGHLTSIITSNDKLIAEDSLSKEVYDIRCEIAQLKKTETEKLCLLLKKYDELLAKNCMRIGESYATLECPDINVEPAIGYFIPDIHVVDPIFYGAEPSAIITALQFVRGGFAQIFTGIGNNWRQIFTKSRNIKISNITGKISPLF